MLRGILCLAANEMSQTEAREPFPQTKVRNITQYREIG